MGIYYIRTEDGSIYSLDSTESFEFSEGGSLTEYAIESGAKASDHYVNENKVFSLSGIITDFKSTLGVNIRDTDDFINSILKVKKNKETFSLYYRDVGTIGDRFFDNLMFESISFSQDANFGYAYGKYAYRVSMSLKQIEFADRATLSKERIPVPRVKDKASDKKDSSAATAAPPPLLRKSGALSTDPSSLYVRDQLSRAQGK